MAPRFQTFERRPQQSSSSHPIVVPDLEAQVPTAPVEEDQRGQQLDVQGSLSATFRTPSPLSSVSLTVRYKSEKPVYPDLRNFSKTLGNLSEVDLPSVPSFEPSHSDSDDSFHSLPEPSAPALVMEDFGNDMSTNNEALNIVGEVRPLSADSGIQSDDRDAGTSTSNPLLTPSSSTGQAGRTSTSSTNVKMVQPQVRLRQDEHESDIDPSDHEEGEVSDSESAAEDDGADQVQVQALQSGARANVAQAPLLLGQAGPTTPPIGQIAQPVGSQAQVAQPSAGPSALPASGTAHHAQGEAAAQAAVAAPGQVRQPRGRRGGARGRGRPRRRQTRKRPWDLSDGSVSSTDDEASFPSRISPRKKPFQGYRHF